MPIQIIRFVATCGLLAALAACSSQASPDYQEVAPASISPGDPIPSPTDRTILTLYGDLSVTNAGNTLQFDIPTLEKLGLVEYTVKDPWLKSDVTYTGVLMSDLVKYTGLPPAATHIHLAALDDYEVDISLADIKKWPVLLATRTNGEYMTIENSGPTRIIFPYNAYPEINQVKYDDLWIWNIKSMEIN